jgi:hypothetical protein
LFYNVRDAKNAALKVTDMPECSLCKSPLDYEGGFVLFTDYRGKPFKVCGTCVGSIVLYHNPACEEDKQRALDYISGYRENIASRVVYGELMKFLNEGTPKKANDLGFKPEDVNAAVVNLKIREDALKEETEYIDEMIKLRRRHRYGGWIPLWSNKGSALQFIFALAVIIIAFIIRYVVFRR